ncbi:MAG TPA: DUF6174 domain-containing protein [Longimicrobiaceae bacterium]|jgi:hypothetical protein
MIPIRPHARRTLAVLAALALALPACAVEPEPATDAESELAANRERWESRGVEDYGYAIRRACECEPEEAGPARVEVRGGETASVGAVEGGPEIRREAFDSLDNFRELFRRVQAEMEAKPDELKAGYDAEWGYPVYLHVDPRRDVPGDERGFRVDAFAPLR